MRLTDLVVFPLLALWQQKTRTTLTTLGVTFGAFVLAASMSINHGMQETIARESRRTDALRRITVFPRLGVRPDQGSANEIVVEGEMSEDKRERIRAALAMQQNQSMVMSTERRIDEETLQVLSSLEHVETAEPYVEFGEFVRFNGHTFPMFVQSSHPQHAANRRRVVAGRFFETPDEPSAVVSEFFLYRCGVIDDEAVESAIGKKLRIEMHSYRRPDHATLWLYLSRPNGVESTPEEVDLIARLNRRLPTVLDQLGLTPEETQILQNAIQEPPPNQEPEEVIAEEYTIVGVIRQLTNEETSNRRWWDDLGTSRDVLLPYETATDFFFRSPRNRSEGLSQMTLIVDREEHVKSTAEQVEALNLQAQAPIEFIERERLTWRLVFGGMTCVAVVALLVAAMGIVNTMLMSVLERTREIGIMKAVGASDSQIQVMFLIEGALIGMAGGVVGLLLAWAAAFPGDAWVRGMIERDLNVKLLDALFVFPLWLATAVILFATVITIGAAYYPARRASRINPITALRHE